MCQGGYFYYHSVKTNYIQFDLTCFLDDFLKPFVQFICLYPLNTYTLFKSSLVLLPDWNINCTWAYQICNCYSGEVQSLGHYKLQQLMQETLKILVRQCGRTLWSSMAWTVTPSFWSRETNSKMHCQCTGVLTGDLLSIYLLFLSFPLPQLASFLHR